MILVDSSVRLDHLRRADGMLAAVLDAGEVMVHPFVAGELACGNLHNRGEVLRLLGALHVAPVASQREALMFIETRALMGRGIGFVDVHLLASVVLAGSSTLWTRDRRLAAVARALGLEFVERR